MDVEVAVSSSIDMNLDTRGWDIVVLMFMDEKINDGGDVGDVCIELHI